MVNESDGCRLQSQDQREATPVKKLLLLPTGLPHMPPAAVISTTFYMTYPNITAME
jgi:hypothetical protein